MFQAQNFPHTCIGHLPATLRHLVKAVCRQDAHLDISSLERVHSGAILTISLGQLDVEKKTDISVKVVS